MFILMIKGLFIKKEASLRRLQTTRMLDKSGRQIQKFSLCQKTKPPISNLI